MEQWRDIPNYEGIYQASNLGNIKSLLRTSSYKGRWGDAVLTSPEMQLKQEIKKSGYHYVHLSKEGCGKGMLVHRLVLSAFISESNLQCNHIDGNKSNNNLENLEYCTSQQNNIHCINVLGKKRGTGSGSAKVNADQALAIRDDKRILREIAKDYGITLQAVHYIQKGKNWGWLNKADGN
jgi:hypothetical protein